MSSEQILREIALRENLPAYREHLRATLLEAERNAAGAAGVRSAAEATLDRLISASPLAVPTTADKAIAAACGVSLEATRSEQWTRGAVAAVKTRLSEIEELLSKETK